MRVFETIAANSAAPIFIFGDHASNFIPLKLNKLGLSGDDLTRHIAWDIGTAGLVDGLCESFGCGGLKAGVSRLVVDVHRDLNAAGVIPEHSDGTYIAANANLSPTARVQRLKIHADYHRALGQQLDAVMPLDPLIVSMHSFTPHPKTGTRRDMHIGFLYKGDLETTLMARANVLRLCPNYIVGLNEPYSAFDLYYTLDRHVIDRGLRHLMFEIRQDLVDTPAKVAIMTDILERVLKPLI